MALQRIIPGNGGALGRIVWTLRAVVSLCVRLFLDAHSGEGRINPDLQLLARFSRSYEEISRTYVCFPVSSSSPPPQIGQEDPSWQSVIEESWASRDAFFTRLADAFQWRRHCQFYELNSASRSMRL